MMGAAMVQAQSAIITIGTAIVSDIPFLIPGMDFLRLQ